MDIKNKCLGDSCCPENYTFCRNWVERQCAPVAPTGNPCSRHSPEAYENELIFSYKNEKAKWDQNFDGVRGQRPVPCDPEHVGTVCGRQFINNPFPDWKPRSTARSSQEVQRLAARQAHLEFANLPFGINQFSERERIMYEKLSHDDRQEVDTFIERLEKKAIQNACLE